MNHATVPPTRRSVTTDGPRLIRETFRTSRLLDFATTRELSKQVGHGPDAWPLVIGKEAFDNSLDACEEAGIAPYIAVEIPEDFSRITIRDNGPGIGPATVKGLLDFTARVSSRAAYCSPTRGAQGNALSAILCMPFALSGGTAGLVEIAAHGVRHRIGFGVDVIGEVPVIDYSVEPDDDCKNGTEITIHWPDSSRSILADAGPAFLQVVENFGILNPSLSYDVTYGEQEMQTRGVADSWQKWLPSDPTSPHWYSPDRFRRLVAACITADADSGKGRTLREFVSTFRGLTSTVRQKAILNALGLSGSPLTALVDGSEIDAGQAAMLLALMREHSAPVRPAMLGTIGRDSVAAAFDEFAVDMDSFAYHKAEGFTAQGLPYIVEAAFGWLGGPPYLYEGEDEDNPKRRLIVGVNWSPSLGSPLRAIGGQGLDGLLAELMMGPQQPIMLLLHIALPGVEFLDHGKSAIHFADGEVIEKAIRAISKKWTTQCYAELRSLRATINRRARLTGAQERKVSAIDAAEIALPDAWAQASGDGALPAFVRQIFYAARERIAELTGKELDYKYFAQTLLPDYIESHGVDWDVVYDSRGAFEEPHTGEIVPLGTLAVRAYLAEVAAFETPTAKPRPILPTRFPTQGPCSRFAAILFVEKAGFGPLFEATHIAERFDIGIMSSKGFAVTAARSLAETICAHHNIPLLILHDFDISGLGIAGTLQSDTRRYQFTRDFRVIDLGLRLADLPRSQRERERMSERVEFGPKVSMAAKAFTLRRHGATEAEIEFLTVQRRRVELNALSSPALVALVERKLREHGIGKVIPDAATLAVAAKRLLTIRKMQAAIDAIAAEDEEMTVPAKLAERLARRLARNRAEPWDEALAAMLKPKAG